MSLPTYDEALALMRSRIRPLGRIQSRPLDAALGSALARELIAREDHPRFDNSAVDGYAVGRAEDSVRGARLPIAARIAAGASPEPIPAGACVRILTGAEVPENAFGVVMQEDVMLLEGEIDLRVDVPLGAGIRRTGSDVRSGERLLESGARIGSGAVALAASQGLTDLELFAMPSVAVVTTGNELVDASEQPIGSQLRDSNRPMLAAALAKLGVPNPSLHRCGDDLDETRRLLAGLAVTHDLVLVAGGASVGDHDHVAEIVRQHGEVVFHGVRLRPGKPVLFGFVGDTPCFGLPGNPASAFVCFHLFAAEAIRRLSGFAAPEPAWVEARFVGERFAEDRDRFERAKLRWSDGYLRAEPFPMQDSFGLRALAEANCLVRIRSAEDLRDGAPCQALPLS